MLNGENSIKKKHLMKLVKLSIDILKEENALDSFIYYTNDYAQINLTSVRELSQYMLNKYLENNYCIESVNPIARFFLWDCTTEGLSYWSNIGGKFDKQARSKFKCLYNGK